MRPLAIDLFAGLGGWTDGLLEEGWRVIGFDIERHDYGTGGYPAQLVLQDVLTIHGRQFKDVSLIVASPPCQTYSYMAMPWSRAKQIAAEYRSGARDVKELTALFDACFRIQREASEAAGHHIPMVVENVRGAIPWVGRSRWNYGSFHLWGDVPALMPMVSKRRMKSAISCAARRWDERIASTPEEAHSLHYRLPEEGQKVPGFRFDGSGKSFQTASVDGTKTVGHVNQRDGYSHTRHLTNQSESDGVKQDGATTHGSKSSARKAASAQIAKIPLALSRHIARCYLP